MPGLNLNEETVFHILVLGGIIHVPNLFGCFYSETP